MSDNNFHPCPLDGAIALQISLTHFHVARFTFTDRFALALREMFYMFFYVCGTLCKGKEIRKVHSL